jgi:hypothetical protein
MTGAAAVLALGMVASAAAGLGEGNLSRTTSVPIQVLAIVWAPLSILLGANTARHVLVARRLRLDIDRRVWDAAEGSL